MSSFSSVVIVIKNEQSTRCPHNGNQKMMQYDIPQMSQSLVPRINEHPSKYTKSFHITAQHSATFTSQLRVQHSCYLERIYALRFAFTYSHVIQWRKLCECKVCNVNVVSMQNMRRPSFIPMVQLVFIKYYL